MLTSSCPPIIRFLKLYLLLYPKGILGSKGGKIAHGHEGALDAPVGFAGLGVAGPPELFDGVREPQDVRIDRLHDSGLLAAEFSTTKDFESHANDQNPISSDNLRY